MDWPSGVRDKYRIPLELLHYRDLIFDLPLIKPEVIVEIGSLRGWFAARIATQCPGAKIYCIDPWDKYQSDKAIRYYGDDGAKNFAAWRWNTQPFGDRIIAIKERSANAIGLFKEMEKRPIDMIFIDGDHTYDQVLLDCQLWYPLVAYGGVFSGHDWGGSWGAGVKQAVKKFRRSLHLKGGPNVGKIFRNGIRKFITIESWWWWKGNFQMPKRKLTAREIKALKRKQAAEAAEKKVQEESAKLNAEVEAKKDFINGVAAGPRFKRKLEIYAQHHSISNMEYALLLVKEKGMSWGKAIRIAQQIVGK